MRNTLTCDLERDLTLRLNRSLVVFIFVAALRFNPLVSPMMRAAFCILAFVVSIVAVLGQDNSRFFKPSYPVRNEYPRNTEFRASIQSGSTSPSQTIHALLAGSLTTSLATDVRTPSVHSRVSRFISPRN
uniref:Uncharacterized protein n=1 Tax=Bursaphelenchus xylophilus TaxID=6326 RepID=A0A1I7RIU3_BURXY